MNFDIQFHFYKKITQYCVRISLAVITFKDFVKYGWISTPKASSKGEVALTYIYTQQPGNLSTVGLQTHFNIPLLLLYHSINSKNLKELT
jgi:hypothetical protein